MQNEWTKPRAVVLPQNRGSRISAGSISSILFLAAAAKRYS